MRLLISYTVFAFFVFAQNTIAQDMNIDSLKTIINSRVPDTRKISTYKLLQDILIKKNFDESLDISSAGLKLADKLKDSISIAEFRHSIGVAYYFKGNYDSAAINFYEALGYENKTGNKAGKASVLNSLGRLYRKTKDLDRALQNYNEAFSIYEQLHQKDGMATILNESGVVFEYKADYDEAISRYKRSLAIREQMNDLLGKSYSLNFIGGAYTLQKKYDEAEKYLIESLNIRKKLKDTLSLAFSYSDLASMYAEKHDFDKATIQYQASNDIATHMKYPQLLSENYNMLASIEEKKGNSGQALEYYKKHIALKDSIFTNDKIKQIEELNAKYQAEKKEQELKDQKYEIQIKNYLLWGFAFLAVFVAIAAFSIYNRRQLKSKLQFQQAMMKQQDMATRAVIYAEENERKRIAADLHDGVGQMMSAAKMNLSVFENEIPFKNEEQKLSFEKLVSLVDESCREVRSVSHQMMPNALLKSGLASAVKEFIEKIDSRIIKVSLHTEGLNERIDSNTETVLYRVIQECVNNVLKHSGASHLDISLIKDADGISATIEDNGKGFNSSNKQHFEGIGLKNIISRVTYLKGSIDFDSAPGKGTLVAIHVPLG